MEGMCEGDGKGQETGLRNGCEGLPRAGHRERDPSLGDGVIFSSRDGRLWDWSTAVDVLVSRVARGSCEEAGCML